MEQEGKQLNNDPKLNIFAPIYRQHWGTAMRTNTLHRYLALLTVFLAVNASAWEDSFYNNFLSVVRTNHDKLGFAIKSPSLVDTNNLAPKLKNVEINLERLRNNGEFAGIRLGMSMDEVVTRWGKPPYFHSHCGGGPRFGFSDVSLVFKNNRLSLVYLPENARFDGKLNCDSTFSEWARVLGQPTRREDRKNDFDAWYETPNASILLLFRTNGEMIFPPHLVLPESGRPESRQP